MTRIPFLLALTLVCLTVGCSGPTEPDDFEFGRVDVYVRDAAGAPINGVPVRLERRSGGGVEDAGGVTGSVGLPGYYFFLRNSSSTSFRVAITVPSGYALEPNQSSSIDVAFAIDQTRTVTFLLRKL